jgi:hypothetical protein
MLGMGLLLLTEKPVKSVALNGCAVGKIVRKTRPTIKVGVSKYKHRRI